MGSVHFGPVIDPYIYIYPHGCFPKWGYPKLAGWFISGKIPTKKWMMTGGTPMTSRKPPYGAGNLPMAWSLTAQANLRPSSSWPQSLGLMGRVYVGCRDVSCSSFDLGPALILLDRQYFHWSGLCPGKSSVQEMDLIDKSLFPSLVQKFAEKNLWGGQVVHLNRSADCSIAFFVVPGSSKFWQAQRIIEVSAAEVGLINAWTLGFTMLRAMCNLFQSWFGAFLTWGYPWNHPSLHGFSTLQSETPMTTD